MSCLSWRCWPWRGWLRAPRTERPPHYGNDDLQRYTAQDDNSLPGGSDYGTSQADEPNRQAPFQPGVMAPIAPGPPPTVIGSER